MRLNCSKTSRLYQKLSARKKSISKPVHRRIQTWQMKIHKKNPSSSRQETLGAHSSKTRAETETILRITYKVRDNKAIQDSITTQAPIVFLQTLISLKTTWKTTNNHRTLMAQLHTKHCADEWSKDRTLNRKLNNNHSLRQAMQELHSLLNLTSLSRQP